MTITLHPHKNECGECTACCKLLGVKELQKPARVWCPHAKKGCGCTIYERRPQACRDFECLWLMSNGPAELRPDKMHGLFTMTRMADGLVLHEDPGYPGHAMQIAKPILQHWIEDAQHYVVVTRGRQATFYGNPALLPAAQAMVAEAFPLTEIA